MTDDSHDVIVKTLARLLVPFILIYALYVIMHGHHSPGGGFQGGVILAAALILYAVSHGFEKAWMKLSENAAEFLGGVGVLIYGGIGMLCVFLGGNFLDYGALNRILQVGAAESRSLGILGVEIGVAITVMAVMCIIFFIIYSADMTPEKDKEK